MWGHYNLGIPAPRAALAIAVTVVVLGCAGRISGGPAGEELEPRREQLNEGRALELPKFEAGVGESEGGVNSGIVGSDPTRTARQAFFGGSDSSARKPKVNGQWPTVRADLTLVSSEVESTSAEFTSNSPKPKPERESESDNQNSTATPSLFDKIESLRTQAGAAGAIAVVSLLALMAGFALWFFLGTERGRTNPFGDIPSGVGPPDQTGVTWLTTTVKSMFGGRKQLPRRRGQGPIVIPGLKSKPAAGKTRPTDTPPRGESQGIAPQKCGKR